MTPQITPDNRIIMTVEVRKDSVGQFVQLGGGFQVPSIDTRNVTTQISVNNGDTAVIGGIYEETIRNDVDKVPWLGDIPMLGYLFKTTGRSEREDRAPDLPDAARRQGIGQRIKCGERYALGGRSALAAAHPMPPAPVPLHARVHLHRGNLFWSACRARASRRSAASSRGVSTRRSSTPMPSSSAGSA